MFYTLKYFDFTFKDRLMPIAHTHTHTHTHTYIYIYISGDSSLFFLLVPTRPLSTSVPNPWSVNTQDTI